MVNPQQGQFNATRGGTTVTLLQNGAIVHAVQKPSEEIDIKLLAF